jgi:tRNA-dihydrouridine synthase B
MFRYMLAPLEDYTGPALRKLCFDNGCDLTFSEMTRVEGIIRKNKATLSKIEVKGDTPMQIQLLPGNESQLERYISGFEPFDGFCGFNLNLCCPSKNIVKYGRGGAMVKRIAKTNKLLRVIHDAGYATSIKLTLGLNRLEKTNKVYLHNIIETNADFYVVQAKTSIQKSNVEYDYSVLSECVDTGKEIIANGGIDSITKVDLIKKAGCDGVMLGRSAVLNPAIFNELKGKKVKSLEKLKQDYSILSQKYDEKDKYYTNFLKVIETNRFD